MIRDLPILMGPELVRAILDGRKTETRRPLVAALEAKGVERG